MFKVASPGLVLIILLYLLCTEAVNFPSDTRFDETALPPQSEPCRPFVESGKPLVSLEYQFSSPNDENAMYRPNMDCVKLIQAPPGSLITLDFRDKFHIEPSTDCEYDYLEIRDGPYGFSVPMGKGRFCSSKFPLEGKKLVSSGPFLWLRFRSDGTIQNNGFKAVYEFIDQGSSSNKAGPACRVAFSVTSERSMSEAILPTDYMKSQIKNGAPLDCTIDISSVADSKIFLRFAFLNFPDGTSCSDAYLEVFDGFTVAAWNPGKRTLKVCKRNAISSKLTSDRRVVLRLFSKTQTAFPKFTLTATTIYKAPCRSDQLDCGRSFCVDKKLLCNGRANCPNGRDEACEPPNRYKQSTEPGLSDAPASEPLDNGLQKDAVEVVVSGAKAKKGHTGLPYHSIILGVIGGLLAVFITICMTITIRQRSMDLRGDHTIRRRRKASNSAPKPAPVPPQGLKAPPDRSGSPSPELSRLLDASQLDRTRLNGTVPAATSSCSFPREDRRSLTPPPPPSGLPRCKMHGPVVGESRDPSRDLHRDLTRDLPHDLPRDLQRDITRDPYRDLHLDLHLVEQQRPFARTAEFSTGGSDDEGSIRGHRPFHDS